MLGHAMFYFDPWFLSKFSLSALLYTRISAKIFLDYIKVRQDNLKKLFVSGPWVTKIFHTRATAKNL